MWEVIEKESCGLERLYGCLYVHFEIIMDFARNEQMGCSEAFRDNTNGTKHPGRTMLQVMLVLLGTFREKIMIRLGEV